MIESFGGRKFVGFLFITVLLTVLCLFDKITGDAFIQFVTLNFGIFVVGNTIVDVKTPEEPEGKGV